MRRGEANACRRLAKPSCEPRRSCWALPRKRGAPGSDLRSSPAALSSQPFESCPEGTARRVLDNEVHELVRGSCALYEVWRSAQGKGPAREPAQLLLSAVHHP
jgi:hypothetical protein